MKLIGYLLMTAALILGAVASTTAYVPPISLSDEAFKNASGEYATLWDGAGKGTGDEPLVAKGTHLTPEVLAQLRAATDPPVERVRVRSFAWGRWSHKYHFLLACAGLLVGGFLVKSAVRKEALAAPATDQPATSPEAAVAAIAQITRDLVADLPRLPKGDAGCEEIIARLDPVQKEYAPTVVDARSKLLGRLGMGGYAQFMDRFSALERQLNRAWSAAADGVMHESQTCLHAAHALVPDVEARLKGA